MGKDRMVLCFKYIRLPVKNNRRLKLPFEIGGMCSRGVKEEKKVKKDKKGLKESSKMEEVDSSDDDSSAKRASTKQLGKSAGSALATGQEGDEISMAMGYKNGGRTSMEPGGQTGQPQICRVLSVRNGVDGAQVVAGWPSWLTSAAGEAIKGLIPRKADAFEKLDKIGQGTYSSVYRARDLEARKTVALKKVRFVNMDPESVRFMAREILILRRLDHPNVMKLEGLVFSTVSGNLYLVFEYMEHDLSGLAAATKFTEPQIKCFMQQLLRGLEHCHNRGVLHRDIKASNLLIDNNGNLKIADFGLAHFFHIDQKQCLTSRVVTLWYRPPELLLGATDYEVAVDLWSSGCILAELFVGKPIMPGRTEVEQLHKIFKLCGSPSEEYWTKSKLTHAPVFKPQQSYKRRVSETFKDFPPSAISLLETLLAFEPEHRGTATSAVQSEFFTTKPLPCDPSSLPKYPPSKELDARMRDEEARRQRVADGKGETVQHPRKGSKNSKPVPTHYETAEFPLPKHKEKSNTKSNCLLSYPDDGGSSILIEPSRTNSRAHHSRPECASGELSHADGELHRSNSRRVFDFSAFQELKNQRSFKPQAVAAAELESYPNSRYEQIDGADSSNNRPVLCKENPTGYSSKKGISWHCSGPLLPRDGNMEEMLKEHEKKIQVAVRKALADKKKSQ